MAANRLRVVEPDEHTTPPRKLSVTQAASEGTARELLVAMRDRVAKDVENPNTPSRDLAALTRRLLEITKEIEAIDAIDAQAGRDGDDGDSTPDDAWEAV